MANNEPHSTPLAGGGYSPGPSPPYQNRYLLVLQVTALVLLVVLVYFNIYLLTTELSYLPSDMMVSRETYSIIGFALGFLLVLHARFSFMTRRRIKLVILIILLILLVLLILPFLGTYVVVPPALLQLHESVVLFFDSLFLFSAGSIFLFTLVPLAGVHGILLGSKRSIFSSLLSLLTGMIGVVSLADLDYFEDDIITVFLETSKFTLFSVFFLAYAELGFAIAHFTERHNQASKYDIRMAKFYDSEDSFQLRYGMDLPRYPENYAVSQMTGVLLIFIPFLTLMITFSLAITLFSVNFDFLFASVMTEAYKNSIVAKTIFGKVLFVVFFFATILVVRGMVPSRTKGGQTIRDVKTKKQKKNKKRRK